MRRPGGARGRRSPCWAGAPAVDKVVELAPIDQRPDDELLVEIDGGVEVVAGTMLALGECPRLASTSLAASLIPTTLSGHRSWGSAHAVERQTQQEVHPQPMATSTR